MIAGAVVLIAFLISVRRWGFKVALDTFAFFALCIPVSWFGYLGVSALAEMFDWQVPSKAVLISLALLLVLTGIVASRKVGWFGWNGVLGFAFKGVILVVAFLTTAWAAMLIGIIGAHAITH